MSTGTGTNITNVIIEGPRQMTIRDHLEIETEQPSREPVDALIDRADRLKLIRKEIARQREFAAQLRDDLYSTEARIGELRGEWSKLTSEAAP